MRPQSLRGHLCIVMVERMLEITVLMAEEAEVMIMDGDGRVMEVIMVRMPVEVKQWWRW